MWFLVNVNKFLDTFAKEILNGNLDFLYNVVF